MANFPQEQGTECNTILGDGNTGKYSLCEINVSCVSPFPPSAINFIVDEVTQRISRHETWEKQKEKEGEERK